MKNYLLTTLLAAGMALSAGATTPQWHWIEHTQPDGKVLSMTVEANGRFTVYSTNDGMAMLRGEDGNFYYARLMGGKLVRSNQLAHDKYQRSAEEQNFVESYVTASEQAYNLLDDLYPQETVVRKGRFSSSTEDGLGKYKVPGTGIVSSIGSPTIPVVMVEFSDRKFQDTITVEKISRFFNEKGYADERGSIGSVKDYFVAQSQGLFQPTFEVVAKVAVSKGYAEYGKDGENGAIDPYAVNLITDALSEAEKAVDFSKYKVDQAVPLVAVMFAGPGQQSSFENGRENYIWAKFSRARSFSVNEGKVKISSYFIGNELLQSYGEGPNDVKDAHLDGVGLFCHEFGHALGLPDFYYTGRDRAVKDSLLTMDYWSIMDYGQYFFNGYAPPGYTAFERSSLGWLDVKELKKAQYAELYAFGQEDKGATAYVIRNPENAKEYYLLENRQPDTWYPKRMGAGMLVTHVDYDENAWGSNTVNNNPNRQRMAYLPADNVKDGTKTRPLSKLFDGYKGDLFPGTKNVVSLTDDTTPYPFLNSGEKKKLGMPLYNISMKENGMISFSFIDESLTGIKTPWNTPDANAENQPVYTLSGRRVDSWKNAEPGVYILQNGHKIVKK